MSCSLRWWGRGQAHDSRNLALFTHALHPTMKVLALSALDIPIVSAQLLD